MIARDERELRERFAMMRSDETAGAPAFQGTLAAALTRSRSRPRPLRRSVTVAAALALVALVLLLTLRNRQRSAVDFAGVRVHAPTDFLLQLPGAELLRSVPRLGRVNFDRRIL